MIVKAREIVIFLAFCLTSPLILSGCAAAIVGAAAGAGTIAFTKGGLQAVERYSIDKTWEAALGAMDEAGFLIINKEKGPVFTRLNCQTAGGKRFYIELSRIADNLTEIKIRVGVLGDEPLSREILSKIQENLKREMVE